MWTLAITLFLNKNRAMDNVQKHNILLLTIHDRFNTSFSIIQLQL
jgi:hypothetical protein